MFWREKMDYTKYNGLFRTITGFYCLGMVLFIAISIGLNKFIDMSALQVAQVIGLPIWLWWACDSFNHRVINHRLYEAILRIVTGLYCLVTVYLIVCSLLSFDTGHNLLWLTAQAFAVPIWVWCAWDSFSTAKKVHFQK